MSLGSIFSHLIYSYWRGLRNWAWTGENVIPGTGAGVGQSTPWRETAVQDLISSLSYSKQLFWLISTQTFRQESLRVEGEVERGEGREGKGGERTSLGAFTGAWYRSEPKPEPSRNWTEGAWNLVGVLTLAFSQCSPGTWTMRMWGCFPSLGWVIQSSRLSLASAPLGSWEGFDSLRPSLMALVFSACVFFRTPGFVPSSFYLFVYLLFVCLFWGTGSEPRASHTLGKSLNYIPLPSFYLKKKERKTYF